MHKNGYDGCSGLGSHKKGIIEPIVATGQSCGLGLGFKPFFLGPPNPKISLCTNVDTSSDDKASENIEPELVEIEPNTNDPDSPYALDHMFNPNELPIEDKHVPKTLSSPQNILDPLLISSRILALLLLNSKPMIHMIVTPKSLPLT